MKYNNSNNLPFLQNKYKTNMKCWNNLFLVALLAFSLGSCIDDSDPNAQLNKETKAIDDYLKSINNTDYVAYDATGMRVVVKEFGNDAPPHEGQTVKVTYTATVLSESVPFESLTIEKKVEDISLVGLQRGVLSILKGTHAVLYIPSKYAFGTAGRNGVPPNSTVVYDIVLEEITRTATEQTQFQSDTAAIHNYLKFNQVANTHMHESGVWYTVQAEGTGTQPKAYDRVSFKYTGKILTNSSTFDEGNVYAQGNFSFIDGLKIGIPLMKEGGKATFYIPSGYGYGAAGVSGVVGANSNLVFEIELNDVTQ
jgi:FKBP-type peptidyl-prolyl cis-trans isomerase